jgi:hypothetical protein
MRTGSVIWVDPWLPVSWGVALGTVVELDDANMLVHPANDAVTEWLSIWAEVV